MHVVKSVCWFVFCRLDAVYGHLGRGTSVENMLPSHWPVARPVINDPHESTQPTVGGDTPGQVVLDDVLKQVQKTMESKLCSSATVPDLKFLP